MLAASSALVDRLPAKTRTLPARLSRQGVRLARPWLDRASSRVHAKVPLLEEVLARVDPTLSLHRILARVVAVREETHDVKTFVLRPNARFGTYRPGAHVRVHLTIDGRAVQRTYSLSSAPAADGTISITVKRVAGGLVSNHLADTTARGHVLELSAPDGQFTLPAVLPEKLLMISAGSGITPVMSMLRHLVATRSTAHVTFLHFARTPRDVIFAQELEDAARNMANVRVVLCVEQGEPGWSGHIGRFSQDLLAQVAPEFRNLDTYLCGPGGFMRTVMHTFEAADADLSKLRFELFNADLDVSSVLDRAHQVRFARTGVDSLSNRPLTILQQAEAQGVRVETGCRAGTCGTCRCRKTRGVVFNLATNRESHDGEEMIYPCVSVARSSVEIDL
ncbi:MAG TPA: hybrid-cluster NAD(P)-dependent oxidoreductase [Polyangiaceae bacterium]|nr:hybrid-cluster NAD(P)-dependent oxidoreductase [Polyangiaceae bacterium]